jgi:dihydrodipicolinate synthase/N-acetylneuraminate lyase
MELYGLVSVIDEVGGRVPVVAHTGAMTTAEAIRLTAHAAAAGAASAMVVLPYYEPLSSIEVERYLGDVASSVDIPLMYYNLPSATGVSLSIDELGSLARRGIIASVKDTGGDASWLDQLLGRYGDDLQVLNGGDTLTFAALTAGVPAAVWGAANIFPELAVELFDAVVVDQDLRRGRELWTRIRGIVGFLEAQSYTARVKAACELVDVTTGPLRRPLLPPGDDEREELGRLLDAAGLR